MLKWRRFFILIEILICSSDSYWILFFSQFSTLLERVMNINAFHIHFEKVLQWHISGFYVVFIIMLRKYLPFYLECDLLPSLFNIHKPLSYLLAWKGQESFLLAIREYNRKNYCAYFGIYQRMFVSFSLRSM